MFVLQINEITFMSHKIKSRACYWIRVTGFYVLHYFYMLQTWDLIDMLDFIIMQCSENHKLKLKVVAV